jgi:hypothetical protein
MERANREIGREVQYVPALVQAIRVLGDGHLLVQIAEEFDAPGHNFDVFDPEGLFLGTLRTDLMIEPGAGIDFRGDTLVAVTVGTLDVPYVVRAVIQRSGT